MCKVPVGGDLWIHKVQGAVGWELTPEGQGQAARGSWVMGHGEEFCLCSGSSGSPGSAVGRGEACSELHPDFYGE